MSGKAYEHIHTTRALRRGHRHQGHGFNPNPSMKTTNPASYTPTSGFNFSHPRLRYVRQPHIVTTPRVALKLSPPQPGVHRCSSAPLPRVRVSPKGGEGGPRFPPCSRPPPPLGPIDSPRFALATMATRKEKKGINKNRRVGGQNRNKSEGEM